MSFGDRESVTGIPTCDEVRERLPWFARGTLAADERAAVAAHLSACDGCRAELADTRRAFWIASRHLPAELLADYGAGLPLGDWPRDLIESHLAHCVPCREDLALDEVLVAPAPTFPPRRPAAASTWRALSLAAALVAAVAAGWLGGRIGRAPGPIVTAAPSAGRAALVELEPESARTRAAGEPAAASSSLPLAVVLRTDLVADAPQYRLRVLAPGGALLHVIEGLAPDASGAFVVLVDASRWPPGELRLELEAASRSGGTDGWTPFESYRLRLDG
jgi:hypothetical protein